MCLACIAIGFNFTLFDVQEEYGLESTDDGSGSGSDDVEVMVEEMKHDTKQLMILSQYCACHMPACLHIHNRTCILS